MLVEPSRKKATNTNGKDASSMTKNTLYVSNIAPAVTEEELHKLFVSAGELRDCRLVKHSDSGNL